MNRQHALHIKGLCAASRVCRAKLVHAQLAVICRMSSIHCPNFLKVSATFSSGDIEDPATIMCGCCVTNASRLFYSYAVTYSSAKQQHSFIVLVILL